MRYIWLVVTGTFGWFFHILGMENHPNWRSHIFRKGLNHQPDIVPGFFSGALSYEESMVIAIGRPCSKHSPPKGPLLERHCRTAMVFPVRTGNRAEFLSSAGQKLRGDYKTMMIIMGMYQKQFLLSCHHHHFTWNKRTVFLLQFLNRAMLAGESIFDPSLLEKIWIKSCIFPGSDGSTLLFFICELGAWCPLPGPLFGVKFQLYHHENPVKYKCRIWTPWPMAFIENNIDKLTDTMPA